MREPEMRTEGLPETPRPRPIPTAGAPGAPSLAGASGRVTGTSLVAVKRRRSSARPRVALLYLVALVALAVMVLPYIYLLLQSLAPWDQVDRRWIPTGLSLRSFNFLLTGGQVGSPQPWMRAFFNSILVTVVDSLSMVAVGGIVGYALSVLRFRGQRLVNSFILFQMFYPGIILLVPTFLLIRYLGLYNTYWAMIVPQLVNLWAIFMYTGFFRSVPPDIIDAAGIDGAGDLGIIFRIMLPLSRSITTVIFLFLFMARWTELLWDMIVVKDTTRQTLNVLMASQFGPYGGYPGPLYASGVLLTFPILILFLLFARNFVEGVQFVLR